MDALPLTALVVAGDDISLHTDEQEAGAAPDEPRAADADGPAVTPPSAQPA